MPREDLQRVLKEFGTSVDVPEIELDEDNYCAIATGDGVLLNIDYVEESEDLIIFTTLGAVPPEARVLVFQDLLEANFRWQTTAGGTLCLDPTGEYALMMYRVDADNLTVEELSNLLTNIGAITLTWAARLAEIVEEPEEDAVALDAPAASGPASFA